jgi:hypothetical protein
MQTYINNLLLTLNWPKPRKPQLSPFIATHFAYGKKTQLTPDEDRSALLSPERLLCVQKIVGSLLYYTRAMDNKLLVAINAIASRQSKATVHTEQLVHTLLDYVAMYPNYGIIYQASNMVLCAHTDASYLNKTESRIRAGAHIYLSEVDPIPRLNGTVLTIATIIKFVMALAAEAELAALFIAAHKMVPRRQTLIDMGWPQPRSPVQTNNSTAIGVTNKTIVAKRAKMMDMRLWCLRCRGSQKQFRYYWDVGSKNWADYSTKHHPDIYHKAHHATHEGIWNDQPVSPLVLPPQ